MMIVDPYRFAASGPPGDVVIAVQDFESGTTAGGTTSVTSSALTGITPKGIIAFTNIHDQAVPADESVHASFSFGAATATNVQSAGGRSRDNVATTNVAVAHSNTLISRMFSGTTTTLIKEFQPTLISGGADFLLTSNSGVSTRVAYMAFAGADTSAHTNFINLSTGGVPIDVNTVGFQPDAVIFLVPGLTSDGQTQTNRFRFGIGFATSDGAQICTTWSEGSAVSVGSPYQVIVTDRCGAQIDGSGSVVFSVEASSFDSSGFSVTQSADSLNLLSWFAIKTGRRFKIVEFTTPTSTGSSSITGAGFTPQAAIVVLTNLESTTTAAGLGALTTDDLQSGLGISFVSDETWAFSQRINSGSDTTDTASYSESLAILGASATDCEAIKASFTAWTSDGMTVNYSAVQGTGKKGFILFIE